MRGLLILMATLMSANAHAAVTAARDLPPGTIIGAADLAWIEEVPGGIDDPALAIGMQARVAIYEGRPVVPGALRAPVLVSRNQIVRVAFDTGSLRIETEGRALSEGAAGDVVRVMNLASRNTISALVNPDGTLVSTSSKTEIK
ncbi:flagellar basal body P-ring formation chaperone FlgA [Paracoccus xiamenensis]|uniref:flagellar basal body P-ring formation chaperone FlgA n=1 Tax=Paracoccus xiamenensis TaxID=2714901 RepID=UPI0014072573|nr:flagellar basal body P-ring formation chaperone FlgA [Paracoccus xiamenensis]NHF73676.1 flagellar basal body P-ring formation protein FlgA [Paracoccus xiamenensis]